MKPEPSKIAHAYQSLGRPKQSVFPISFRSAIAVEGKQMEGSVPAFLYLEHDLVTVTQVS
jgi:hypothetical protein